MKIRKKKIGDKCLKIIEIHLFLRLLFDPLGLRGIMR
jgi:hypothetical protein